MLEFFLKILKHFQNSKDGSGTFGDEWMKMMKDENGSKNALEALKKYDSGGWIK